MRKSYFKLFFIDEVNEEIIHKVNKRMSEVMRIIEYKKEHGLDVREEERGDNVMKQFADHFEELGYPCRGGRQLCRVLINLAINKEREELDKRRGEN